MIEGNRILAVVPARGGSKGIPLKNISPILGVPLVAIVGNIVKEIRMIDRAVVSTDHPEIERIAKEAGLDAPFRRPADLSGDIISDWDVLVNALSEVERIDKKIYDIVVMLQPTSPMRKAAHVTEAIEKLVREDLDSVWTVSPTDSKNHPLKQLKIVDQKLEYYDPSGEKIIARQQLDAVYHRNGIAYVITRKCLLEQKTIKGRKAGALVVNDIVANIDTPWDLKLAEFLMRKSE